MHKHCLLAVNGMIEWWGKQVVVAFCLVFKAKDACVGGVIMSFKVIRLKSI